MPSNNEPRVIVALDFDNARDALALASRLHPSRCAVKVGSELFTTAGPDCVRDLVLRGFNVFLDLKFHDIPNTVAQACAAATRLGVWMMNVHAAGGRSMLAAASNAVRNTSAAIERAAPRLIAVTVLTSLSDDDLREMGQTDNASTQALRLAQLTHECGLDGVVCSAIEARAMRERLGASFALVTPGIRAAGAATDDQSRIATPEAAVANGADFLVVGRPITRATDPVAVLDAVNRAIGSTR